MSIRFYMDVHIKSEITNGLRKRGVDVLTAQDDGAAILDDSALLDRAGELGRILFSQDTDLLSIAADRQRKRKLFAGLIYVRQQGAGIGSCIDQLELIATLCEPADMANHVEYLKTR